MSYMRFNFRSQALGHYVDVSIVYPTDTYSYYPQDASAAALSLEGVRSRVYSPGMKFQTVYLIHGGGDDDTLTYRYSNAERYAQENNVMLVTPNITNSFGIDTRYGVKYQTFLSKELPVVIQSLFASSPKREDNFIMGYAMGGNVALGTALMNPALFQTCVDISGGIGMTLSTDTLKEELNGTHFKNNFPLYNSSFGEGDFIADSPYNLEAIARKNLLDSAEVCSFHIICGSDEFIRGRVEKDVEKLEELGYSVNYICPAGYTHDFVLWDKYIKLSLEELLPLKR
jgi:putative tributyrin esterase